MKKILKVLLIAFLIFSTSKVSARVEDTTYMSRIFEGSFAVQKSPNGNTRMYYARVFNLAKDGKVYMGYCIDIGKKLSDVKYNSTNDYTVVNLTKEEAEFVSLVAYYGYKYTNHVHYKYFLAAQELIWERLGDDEIYWTKEEDPNGVRDDVEAEKREIMSLVDKHYIKPKFKETTIKYNEAITLTDENGVLNEYDIVNVENAKYSKQNNELRIIATSFEPVKISFKRKLLYNNEEFYYYAPNTQNLVSNGKVIDNYHTLVIDNKGTDIKINKRDYTTGEMIKKSGIGFKLFNVDTNKYICKTNDCNYYTNESGSVLIEELKKGLYRLEEIDKELDNYLYNDEYLEFSIDTTTSQERPQEIDFYNKQPTGSLIINKKGEEFTYNNNEITYKEIDLPDVEFSIITNQEIFYNDEFYFVGDEIAILKTDLNGIIKLDNLPLGTYTIKEHYDNNKYIKNEEEVTVEIKYIDRYTSVIPKEITIKNFLKKGNLEIIKIDKDTRIPLENVLISISDDNHNIIYEGKTNKFGKIILDNLIYGNYYVKEIIPPKGYDNLDLEYPVVIFEDNPNTRLIIENTKTKQQILETPPKTSNKQNKNNKLLLLISLIIITIKSINIKINNKLCD